MNAQAELAAAPRVPLRYLVEFNPRPRPMSDESCYVPMEAISEFGTVDTSRMRPTSDLLSGYSYISDGDVAYAKVTPCFENGKGLLARDLPNGYAFATTEISVLRPRHGLDARFLAWILQSSDFRSPGVSHMTGAGGLRRVPDSFAASFRVPVPRIEVQRAIADYLDRETAQIDAFIAKNEELIALLTERRDSLWSRLFEEATHAGRLVPVRRVVSSIVDGPFGSSLTSAHYSDSGTRVVRLGNIGVNEFRDEDKAFIPDHYAAELKSHAAKAGDVIVAGLGDDRMPLGRACVLPEIGPAIVKADCYRVRTTAALTGEYAAWALSAPPTRRRMKLAARGSTRERLNTSVVLDIPLPVPSLSEQPRIVLRFTDATTKIDAARAVAERAIELARERRAALISAAVTGKIDVGVAA